MAIFRQQPGVPKHLQARPTVWMPAIAVLLFVTVYLPIASALVQVNSPATSVSAATKHPAIAAAPVAAQPIAAPTPVAAPASTPAAAIVPQCKPLSFGMPSQLGLDSAASGLTVQSDTPTFYQIYGNTAGGLRSQIQRCAPGSNGSSSAEFTAETSYNLVWQYDTTVGAGCTIGDVKVGLHTAMALPYWAPAASAATGLSSRWQSFITGLTVHEQGHANLDRLYAAKLTTDLNSLGAMDCSTVTARVTSVVNADVAALNQANDNYDAATNHGATQGAILPSY